MVGTTELTEDFITKLKRRHVEGSLLVAKRTAELLRQVLSTERGTGAAGMVALVKRVGRQLAEAQPREVSIGNMVRRVLHIIREEDDGGDDGGEGAEEPAGPPGPGSGEASPALGTSPFTGPKTVGGVGLGGLGPHRVPSLANLLESEHAAASRSARAKASTSRLHFKNAVIESLNELIDELDGIVGQIADQATDHIHANEVVLTIGMSKTVAAFLLEAAKKRSFHVVVAEGAPSCAGGQMAADLAQAGIPTTAIADSAIFALMARVNMVVVGTHALLANGGAMAPAGTHLVALAAQRHAVPFVMLSGLQKLSPLFPHNPAVTMNDLQSPAAVLPFDAVAGGLPSDEVHAINPAFDYIPPELIALFITDTGGHTPSYVYRLLAEYYSPEDYVL